MLRTALSSLRPTVASSSRLTLSIPRQQPIPQASSSSSILAGLGQQVRWRSQLAPKRTKYRKAHKGRVSIPTGGSLKGTTLQLGVFGLRTLSSVRLSAKQLTSAETSIKRKIKTVKGSECWLRVFPDVPVCVKGNETRMGKGKGAFEYWACRVPVGKVVFEVGGGGIREEVAKEALRLAAAKLPVPTEFISLSSPPRLGNIASHELVAPARVPRVTGAAAVAEAAALREGRSLESAGQVIVGERFEGAPAEEEVEEGAAEAGLPGVGPEGMMSGLKVGEEARV